MPDSPAASSVDQSDVADRSAIWLRRGDQVFVSLLVLAGCVLLTVAWIRLSAWGAPLLDVERLPSRQYQYQLDINQATWIEWTLLDGIGEKLAQRIVANRNEHGLFAKVDDLRRVPGIGPKTLESIRPWLTVATPEIPTEPVVREGNSP